MPFLSLVIRGMGWRLSVPKASPLHWRWGAAMAVLGLALTPLCRGSWTLLLCFGILMPAGLGAFSFGLIMGAVTPLLGEKKASAVSGIINASSGLGSILLALVLRGVLDSFGLWGAIIALCLPMLCLVPVLLLLRKADAKQAESTPPLLRPLLKTTFHDRSYRLLSLTFFTCGFHMAIIETHLYTQFTAYGFTEQSVTYAFSIYGIATVAGSVVSGYLGSRFPMKKVLGGLLRLPHPLDHRLFAVAQVAGDYVSVRHFAGLYRRGHRAAHLRHTRSNSASALYGSSSRWITLAATTAS